MLPRTIESSTTTSALAGDDLGDRVELQPQAVLAQLLAGLDEGPLDVAVLDEAVVLGQAAGAREAARRRVAGVGHGDHEVGLDRRLAREDLAHPPAHRLQRAAAHARVRAREVDVLEHAERLARALDDLDRLEPVLAERDDLAGAHVAHELGADDVERARLAGDAVARRRVAGSGATRPITSGRSPAGSRNAITRSLVISTVEKAPCMRGSTAATASSTRSAGVLAISAAMISESDVEAKLDALRRAARRAARRR